MPRFLSTGSLKISCVKITASSGMSMAPALKSKPFIAANGSMAEDSSDIPTAEAPLKCIISPTITIGRNTHSRKTISFFVFIGFSKFRFSKYKHTNILIQWQIKTLSKKSSSIYWMLLFLPENTLFSRYSPKDRESKSKNNESRFQSLQSCYSGCFRV